MTEKESLLAQQRQLYLIDQLLNEGKLSLADLEEILPAIFHINSPVDSSLIHMSQEGCDLLHIDKEELMPYSAEQLAEFITPETLQHVTPRFVDFYQEDDDRKVIADFQQVRQRGKEGYIWVYTTTKIYRKIQSPISISIPVPNMGLIGERLTGLLEENMFMRQRYQHFASLTKREREVLKLVAVGVKRRHIAEQLHISLHTYDTHRRNIRRKLEIKSFADLMRYAHAFGLVS